VSQEKSCAQPAPAEPEEKTRSQRLREAGYTRRPSWRSLPSDALDDDEYTQMLMDRDMGDS
jgi:hypothetical protein